jgi:CRP-like cAMP-binding protein
MSALELWAEMARAEQARRWAIDGRPQSNMRKLRHGPTGLVDEKTFEMMQAMKGPIATDDLAEAVGITCKSVGNRMSNLRNLGWVRVVGKKARPVQSGGARLVNVWDLTKAGEDHIHANS